MTRFSSLFTLVIGFLAACSGSSSSVGSGPDGGGDEGGGLGTGTSPVVPEGGSPLANGSCSYTLDGTAVVLPGYAAMNGGGNLEVKCGNANVTLELGIGDGTYNGPREYAFAPGKSDGSMQITTSDARYDAMTGTDVATGCIVELTTAPPGNFAPVGSAIAGTFTCSAVPRYAATHDGEFAEQSSGTSNITAGAFNVAIR